MVFKKGKQYKLLGIDHTILYIGSSSALERLSKQSKILTYFKSYDSNASWFFINGTEMLLHNKDVGYLFKEFDYKIKKSYTYKREV